MNNQLKIILEFRTKFFCTCRKFEMSKSFAGDKAMYFLLFDKTGFTFIIYS